MTTPSDLKLPSRMHGGIVGVLITLIVIAAVGGATYFAVTSMLDGDDNAKQQASNESQGLSKADAERIGREEGAKVAREVGYQTALDVAQASGGAALYGDSYASAETTDYGSYGDESTSSGGTETADASGGDAYSSDSYDSGNYDYGSDSYDTGSASSDSAYDTDSSSASSDDYSSDDYSSAGTDPASADDAYASDDYATDDYASDDYGSDSYSSDDYAADDSSTSTQTASAPARSDPNEPEPVVSGKAPRPATAVVPWWPPATEQSSGALKVLYAGTFAGGSGKGIGVLFDGAVKSGQSFGDFISVMNDKGEAVATDWSPANNPALLKSSALPPGRYLVQLKPGLQSAQGRTQTLDIEGPVFID